MTTPIRTAAVQAFSRAGTLLRFQTELAEMQAIVRETLNAEIGELYGIEFTRFEIRGAESDDYRQIVEQERAGTAEARRLARLGVDYPTERRFGIMEKAAGNEGAGTLMGAGIGLGAGMPMGAMFGEMMRGAFPQNPLAPAAGTPPPIPSAPPPLPPQPAAAPEYFVAVGNAPTGPFPQERIAEEIRRGAHGAGPLIWRAAPPNWIPASADPAVAPLFSDKK